MAVDFVERASRDDRPFFLYLAPTAPHLPATPAPRHIGMFGDVDAPHDPSFNESDMTDKPTWLRHMPLLTRDKVSRLDRLYRRQAASLLAVDEMLAKLLDTLRVSGKLDSTYIVFTSDQGLHNGEHRLWRSKLTPYRASNRIPLLVHGPGVPAGRQVQALALLSDIAPTLADLASVDMPEFVDGRSLTPWLMAGAAPSHWRKRVLLEFWPRAGFPVDEREEPLHLVIQVPEYHALRSGRYLYVEYRKAGGNREFELYDLMSDPFELTNLATTADEALLKSLATRLRELKACKARACRVAEVRDFQGK